MCEACDAMSRSTDTIKDERERIIDKILNDKEQRWITNDFDIDETALRRFIYDS
jgi:hypothetical protein